jgi:thiopeptide-type bacteriocin biosynthesis protein
MCSLAAESDEALDRGEFKLLFRGAHGPSGARLLGRFCHADDELRSLTEQHLRAEESHSPDAIYAEVVHLPEGRLGNILSRPVMRDYEIPFLGRGGADKEHQIPASDLLVTVQGQSVFLTSKRLGKRVIPRLTSAHNYSSRSLGVYRFLCTLQGQGLKPGLGFDWGALDGLSFLPRVSSGRSVLARARWSVPRAEIEHLTRGKDEARFAAVQAWKRERGLPTRVLLADGDNELLVDLDNVLSIDSFLSLIKNRPSLTLNELFPGPEELCATGPEGRFASEIVIPYERRPQDVATAPQRQTPPRPTTRIFPPGSEWLYLKVYSGTATCDRILAEVVAPMARQAQAEGACDHWFFIRYGDPDWHLRLRFHGDPQRLHGEVLPLLHAAFNPLMADGRVWRLQFDTYERETERYGGPAGIDLAEKFAHVDSEAVLGIVQALEGDEGAAARWRLALKGTDLLLADLGFDATTKIDVMQQMQTSFATEFNAGAVLRKQMANRLRQERRELDALLEQSHDENHPLAPGLAALEMRSKRFAPIVAELRARETKGLLTAPLAYLAPSYIHMFNNRLLRSEARAQEMVLYDFLLRLTQSRAARERSKKKK